MRYLVVSEDGLKGSIRSSEHFPCIVNVPGFMPADEIVAHVFERFGQLFKPRDGKVYVVVPMIEAKRVIFRKRQDYDVTIEEF